MPQSWIRNWNDPSLTSAGMVDAVAVVLVDYGARVNGIRNVTVKGISVGAAQVTVTIITAQGTDTVSTAVISATGHFEATLQVACSAPEVPAAITVANVGGGLTATDRANVLLQDTFFDTLPEHTQFNFVLARLDYAAGHTDRFHFTRNFVKLDPLPPWWRKIIGVVENNKIQAIDHKKLDKNINSVVPELSRKIKAGEISLDSYYAQLKEILKKNLRSSMGPVAQDDAAAFDALYRYRTSNRAEIASGTKGRKFKKEFSDAQQKLGDGFLVAGSGRVGGQLDDWIENTVEFYRAHLRLGVLFYNRLRIRPTQLVVGEPIYQLALAPGEEVQIRQTTETKQKSSFTEIQDQESERTNTFSSTWSTDLSSSIATNSSFQQSTQIGGGVDGSIPETPISVSADASANLSNASTISQESSVKESIQKTLSISAKMRSQHKVQIEITNEQATAFSTTRTLRNTNQLRSLHHTFHKIYRKEQITLERYNAKLCIRLQVADPANFTRDGFLVGLNKIDPNNTDLYNIVKPIETTDSKERPAVVAPQFQDTILRWTQIPRWVNFSGDLRTIAGSKAQSRDLTTFEFVMTKMDVFFYKDPLHSIGGTTDSNIVPASRLTSPIPNVKVDGLFSNYGGDIQWETEPEIEKNKTAFSLKINLPVVYDGPPVPGSEVEYELVSVTFEVNTAWHPNEAAMGQYYRDMQDERARLTRELNANTQIIYDLHAIAESDYPQIVIQRALAEELDFSGSIDAARVKDIFDLDGVVIESVPFWAEPISAERYRYLATRLKNLPINLEMHRILTDCLVASRAIVFLPIKEGYEEVALSLLKESKDFKAEIANNFIAFRNGHFGIVPGLNLPTVDALTAPNSTLATTVDSSGGWSNDWEKNQRTFEILGQWSEIIPTDGIHMESHLSNTSVADEQSRAKLSQIEDGV